MKYCVRGSDGERKNKMCVEKKKKREKKVAEGTNDNEGDERQKGINEKRTNRNIFHLIRRLFANPKHDAIVQ